MMGMFADRSLAEAVADGKVMVLAVYAEGDTEVWKKYLNGMPGNWGDRRRQDGGKRPGHL